MRRTPNSLLLTAEKVAALVTKDGKTGEKTGHSFWTCEI